MRIRLSALVPLLLSSIALAAEPKAESKSMDGIAEQYVKLVLAMGQHDADYVDAFYGPAEWKSKAAEEMKPLGAIKAEATQLRAVLEKVPRPPDEITRLRREYLMKQLSALQARVRIVEGERPTFDEESRALYDAVAPTLPEAHFDKILWQMETKLPGKGPLTERYEKWRERFIVPKEKLDAVFQLAIEECRKRTLARIKLPPEESFRVEYVTGKSWSGYNWYEGNYRSLIQVNTDLPAYIDRAVDLAAHEGYPGHHVYNALLEKHLVRDRGWVEFSVYALFSPQSLIAEGTGNYGKEVVFSKTDRLRFEKEKLFPAAGIDPDLAEEYYVVQEMAEQLSFVGNEAARRYLNGEIDAAAAAAFLEKYALMDPKRAQQRVRFIDQYRSYVINYNLGEEMVRRYVEENVERRTARGQKAMTDAAATRWEIFSELLSSPRLPSSL